MAKIESRENLNRKIASARHSLLLIMIFTVINLLMIMLDTGTYFLFSISVPYYLTMLGMYMENGIIGTYTITGLVISAVILAVYLLCWLLSKKKTGWLTAAFVLMIVDTAALALFTFTLYENPAVNLMDFIFHIWAVATLFHGIRASSKLKKLPAEAEAGMNALYTAIPSLEEMEENVDL